MSGQDPRLAERIGSVQQLSSVVGAMRGIAAARAQQSRHQLAGIRAYAEIVADAISQALGLLPPGDSVPAADTGLPQACVMFCTEQGFAGAFNDRICDAAAPLLDAGAAPFVVGGRGARLLRARGGEPQWSAPMIAQAGSAGALADRIGNALIDALAAGRIGGATIVHAALDGRRVNLKRESLLPLDAKRFPRGSMQPLTHLPAPELFRELANEYLFAQLAAAVLESHAAENSARMQAMAAAQDNIGHRLEGLRLDQQIQRQDVITDELIELAASVL